LSDIAKLSNTHKSEPAKTEQPTVIQATTTHGEQFAENAFGSVRRGAATLPNP
jgi:hypothetical protein